jgi:hypothetical protein
MKLVISFYSTITLSASKRDFLLVTIISHKLLSSPALFVYHFMPLLNADYVYHKTGSTTDVMAWEGREQWIH